MSGYLKADLGRISQMSQTLRALGSEFASLTRVVDAGSAAGNAELASALTDFASGWSDKRDQLASQVQDLAQAADRAVQEYTRTESMLASLVGGTTAGSAPAPGAAGGGPGSRG